MAIRPSFFPNAVTTGTQTAVPATIYGGTRAAPTGLTTLFTGSTTNDRMVSRIDVKGLGVTVAGLLELWLYDGTTHFLIPGMRSLILARTPSTIVDAWGVSIEPRGGIFLPAAATPWELRAGVSVQQTGGLSFVTYGAEA